MLGPAVCLVLAGNESVASTPEALPLNSPPLPLNSPPGDRHAGAGGMSGAGGQRVSG
jgi:hypothetical protein